MISAECMDFVSDLASRVEETENSAEDVGKKVSLMKVKCKLAVLLKVGKVSKHALNKALNSCVYLYLKLL